MGRDLRLARKYELQRLLGRGSVAEVWKAFDTQVKRSVALKLFHSDLQVDLDFITSFERELPIISSLRHPNIVQILDYQISQPREKDHLKAYIVMNYVKGQTLADYILNTSRAGRFPSAADMVHLFTAVGGAIDYAHQHGVIHADIKPSNILLDRQYLLRNPMGEPKLVDFGIAKMLATGTGKFNSQLSTSVFISPEQAKCYPAANELSDIYSLGVILYELCTGKLPFEGENSTDSLMQDISSKPTSPTSINPNISTAVSDVVLRSLAIDPAERFSSASAMTGALALALDEPVSKNLDWFISLSDNHSPSTLLHPSFQNERVELDRSPSLLESIDEPADQKAAWSPSTNWWSPPVTPPATTSPLGTDHIQPPPSRRRGKSLKLAVEEPAPVLAAESPPAVRSEASHQPLVEEPAPVLAAESPPAMRSEASHQPLVEEPAPVLAAESSPVVRSEASHQLAVEEPAPRSWKLGSLQSIVRKQAAEKPVSVLQKHQLSPPPR